MKKTKKIIALLLTLVMVLTALSLNVLNTKVNAANDNNQQAWSPFGGGTDGNVLWDGLNYSNSFSRKVYALGISDILAYLGTSEIQSDELKNMFSEDGMLSGLFIWLRSACSSGSTSAWYIRGSYGFLNTQVSNIGCDVRPAFKIDLSEIDYENITSGGNVPVKHDIIALDARGTGDEHFRVLAADGKKVELLAMTSPTSGQIYDNTGETYNATVSTPTGDQSLDLVQYEGSDLDNAMNAYFNSLKAEIKSAIIDNEIQQDNFYHQGFTSSPGPRETNTLTLKKGDNVVSTFDYEKRLRFTSFPVDSEIEGWYWDEACTQRVDVFNFIPTGDTTLYAKANPDDPSNPGNSNTNPSKSGINANSAKTGDMTETLFVAIAVLIALSIVGMMFVRKKRR